MNGAYFRTLGGPISNTFSMVSLYPSDGIFALLHTSYEVWTFRGNEYVTQVHHFKDFIGTHKNLDTMREYEGNDYRAQSANQ